MTNCSSRHFETELSQLSATYAAALQVDITALKSAISGASTSSIIGVGSGGSYTVASILCTLHETFTGRVSRPSTPLEIVCNPTLAASSPVFLISAEGSNPDIRAALERARHHSARPLHIFTNRAESALVEAASKLTDITTHVFELQDKDGYLATNSLLFDAVLVARAYGELDCGTNALPQTFGELRVGNDMLSDWVDSAASFVKESVGRGAIVVTYSPLLHPIATDFESKLAEGALLHCQLSDLRSFAHGRHLWLAERPGDIVVLALIEPSLSTLWREMTEQFPNEVPTHTMLLSGGSPTDLVSGLIAEMYLVNAISKQIGTDPGRPDVPQFGSNIHYMDVLSSTQPPKVRMGADELSKSRVLGSSWPPPRKPASIRRAQRTFIESIERQQYRSIVFDYDGTLAPSHDRTNPPPAAILRHFTNLLEAGIHIGIASGRGGSVQEQLAKYLPEALLESISLGLYNGGWIGSAAAPPEPPSGTDEFLNHATRIARKLKSLGVPIEDIRPTPPYQVSIRFRDGLPTEDMWFIVADALRQSGLTVDTTFRSNHSVDILAPAVNKTSLISHIARQGRIAPHEILAIGDQGAWPGNDAALLEHRYSLSVDKPSRRLDRGWKLAPSHLRNVDATLWYLEHLFVVSDNTLRLDFTDINTRDD